MGMGGLARPMVVGDRLWLFSQTPAGPTPIQSIMLNGSGTAPPMRPYGPPPSGALHGASVIESARNAILARGQPLNFALPFGLAKPVASAAPGATTATTTAAYVARCKSYTGSFVDYATPHPHNEAYLQLKYATLPPETDAATSNGLAELERVFGDANANFLLQKGVPTTNSSTSCGYGHEGLHQAQRSRRATQSESECSDIDCEQLDEDEDAVE